MKRAPNILSNDVFRAVLLGVSSGVIAGFITGKWSIGLGDAIGVTIGMLMYYRKERRRARRPEMPEEQGLVKRSPNGL